MHVHNKTHSENKHACKCLYLISQKSEHVWQEP